MRLENIPKKYRLLVVKAMARKLSPRKSIKVKCYDCVGYEDVRNMIRDCTVKTCPLHSQRPFQEEEDGSK